MSPNHVDSLLASIVEAPGDDAPRLVLSDLLDQRGDPRGELIAVQCAISRAAGPPDPALLLRERELLGSHGRRWLGELGLRTAEGSFQRCWVDTLTLQPSRLDVLRSPLLSSTPIRVLHIVGKLEAEHASALASLPRLRSLRELRFDPRASPGIGDRGVQALVRTDTLRGLRKLGLRLCA